MDGSETVPLAPTVRATLASGDHVATRIDAALDASYRLAAVILGDPIEAEDAVADAALVAWRARRQLRDLARFDAWFGRILVNTCRDRLRRRRRHPIVEIDATRPDDGPDFRDASHRQDLVARGIARLPADEQVVLTLRFWSDLTVDAIAERTNVPPGTVKSRLNRAMGRLRIALETEEDGT